MTATLRATQAFVMRDAVIFFSYRTRFLSQVASAFLSLAMFHYISQLVAVRGIGGPAAYFAFVVVGIAIFQVLQSVFGTPLLVRNELMVGTFERLATSPFGAVRSLPAMMVFPFTYSLVLGATVLASGWLVFGLDVQWDTAPLAIPVAVLAILAFAPFGVVFGATMVAFKSSAGSRWVMALIALVGGLYFPVALLPEWLEVLSNLQPFTGATELLRHVLVGADMRQTVEAELLKLVGFAVLALPLTLWLLRGAIRVGQRRGTIAEF